MTISVQNDDRIRLISSAMLFTQFINENSSWLAHPLKLKTLAYLQQYEDHPCIQVTREIAREHWICDFICYAVLLDNDPNSLTPHLSKSSFGYELESMATFERYDYSELLRQFSHDSRIGDFWDDTADEWDVTIAECCHIIEQGRIEEFFRIFFGDLPVGCICVPNPLLPASFGFGPNDGLNAYSIIGPPAVREGEVSYVQWGNGLSDIVFHEFCHTFIGKAFTATTLVEETAHWDKCMIYKSWFPEAYPNWKNRVEEIAVRALTVLYRCFISGPNEAHAMLQKEQDEFGIALIMPLYDCFARYFNARKDGVTQEFHDYLPELLSQLKP